MVHGPPSLGLDPRDRAIHGWKLDSFFFSFAKLGFDLSTVFINSTILTPSCIDAIDNVLWMDVLHTLEHLKSADFSIF